jgi:hypothetical protein
MTDIQKLMAATDECGDRLKSAELVRDKVKAAFDEAQSVVHDLTIEHDTWLRAAMMMTPGNDEEKAAPAEPPTPTAPIVSALAMCLGAIQVEGIYTGDGITDRSLAISLKERGYKFNIRTVRNALTAIGKERAKAAPNSPAGLPPSPSPEAVAPPTEASETSPAGGAEGNEHPPIPVFLRREKIEAAE